MRIAVPTEIKNNEFRIAITPVGVHELTRRGHEVYVQAGAGAGSSFTDEEFTAQGARIVEGAEATWAAGEMVLKVKEPIESEYRFLTSDQVLFTYLHLAADRPQTEALLGAGTTAIAYETVQRDDGSLPLLSPMSEVAGCLAPQVGAAHLMKAAGGRGVLFGCVGGVQKAKVVVLGAGTAGQNAARIALGMGADVTILDVDLRKLHRIIWDFDNRIQGLASTALAVREQVLTADLVIGTVLIPGAKTPKLVTDDMVAAMKPGSVLVDVAIDQGGCFEDSRPTTHSAPTFEVDGKVFYCVANMPGAVPHTSTYALTNATLPYALALADDGWRDAIGAHRDLARGLTTHAGALYTAGVGEALGIPAADAAALLD